MSKVSTFLSKHGSDSKIQLLYNFGYSYFQKTFKVSEIEKMYILSKKNRFDDLKELLVDLFFVSSDENTISKDFLEVSKKSDLYKDCEWKYQKKIKEIQARRIAENPYNEDVEKTIIEINNLEERLNDARNRLLMMPEEKITCPYAKQMYGEYLQRTMEND